MMVTTATSSSSPNHQAMVLNAVSSKPPPSSSSNTVNNSSSIPHSIISSHHHHHHHNPQAAINMIPGTQVLAAPTTYNKTNSAASDQQQRHHQRQNSNQKTNSSSNVGGIAYALSLLEKATKEGASMDSLVKELRKRYVELKASSANSSTTASTTNNDNLATNRMRSSTEPNPPRGQTSYSNTFTDMPLSSSVSMPAPPVPSTEDEPSVLPTNNVTNCYRPASSNATKEHFKALLTSPNVYSYATLSQTLDKYTGGGGIPTNTAAATSQSQFELPLARVQSYARRGDANDMHRHSGAFSIQTPPIGADYWTRTAAPIHQTNNIKSSTEEGGPPPASRGGDRSTPCRCSTDNENTNNSSTSRRGSPDPRNLHSSGLGYYSGIASNNRQSSASFQGDSAIPGTPSIQNSGMSRRVSVIASSPDLLFDRPLSEMYRPKLKSQPEPECQEFDAEDEYRDDEDPGYRIRDLWEAELLAEIAMRERGEPGVEMIPFQALFDAQAANAFAASRANMAVNGGCSSATGIGPSPGASDVPRATVLYHRMGVTPQDHKLLVERQRSLSSHNYFKKNQEIIHSNSSGNGGIMNTNYNNSGCLSDNCSVGSFVSIGRADTATIGVQPVPSLQIVQDSSSEKALSVAMSPATVSYHDDDELLSVVNPVLNKGSTFLLDNSEDSTKPPVGGGVPTPSSQILAAPVVDILSTARTPSPTFGNQTCVPSPEGHATSSSGTPTANPVVTEAITVAPATVALAESPVPVASATTAIGPTEIPDSRSPMFGEPAAVSSADANKTSSSSASILRQRYGYSAMNKALDDDELSEARVSTANVGERQSSTSPMLSDHSASNSQGNGNISRQSSLDSRLILNSRSLTQSRQCLRDGVLTCPPHEFDASSVWQMEYCNGSMSQHRKRKKRLTMKMKNLFRYAPSGDSFYPVTMNPSLTVDCFNLKVVFDRDRTGFQENREFLAETDSIVAGRYRVIHVLGQAAFSKALKCYDTVTKQEVCVKVIKNEKDYVDQSLDEIQLLRYINSNIYDIDAVHCLRLIDYFYYHEHLFLVTELLGANLFEFGQKVKSLGYKSYYTIGRIQKIAFQILVALDYVHSLRLIHCDLKPENVLMLDEVNTLVKMIDFGSSCFEDDHLSTYVQSRSYRAPEVLLGLSYDQKIDMWSLGCILAELWTGFVLFQNEGVPSMLARIVGIIGLLPYYMVAHGRHVTNLFTQDGQLFVFLENEPPCPTRGKRVRVLLPKKSSLHERMRTHDKLFVDFLTQLLQIDPCKRPTAQAALSHPWLEPGRYVDGL